LNSKQIRGVLPSFALLQALAGSNRAVDVVSGTLLDTLLESFRRLDLFDESTHIIFPASQSPGGSSPLYVDWVLYRRFAGSVTSSLLKIRRRLDMLGTSTRLVFVISKTTDFGGGGEGGWFCKSHLYTFMYYLHHGLLHDLGDTTGAAPSLLLIDLTVPTISGPALRHFVDCSTSFDGESRDIRDERTVFVHLLDGVYSGSECGAISHRLNVAVQLGWDDTSPARPGMRPSVLIAAAVAEVPSRNFTGSVLPCRGASKAFVDMMKKTSTTNSFSDVLLAPLQVRPLKCLPQSEDPSCFGMPTGCSFVLPFKIADGASLGALSAVLKEANPTFTPPYRRHPPCREGSPDVGPHEQLQRFLSEEAGDTTAEISRLSLAFSIRLSACPVHVRRSGLPRTSARQLTLAPAVLLRVSGGWRPLPHDVSWPLRPVEVGGDAALLELLWSRDVEEHGLHWFKLHDLVESEDVPVEVLRRMRPDDGVLADTDTTQLLVQYHFPMPATFVDGVRSCADTIPRAEAAAVRLFASTALMRECHRGCFPLMSLEEQRQRRRRCARWEPHPPTETMLYLVRESARSGGSRKVRFAFIKLLPDETSPRPRSSSAHMASAEETHTARLSKE
jgi:hypothetical protein